MDQFFLPFLKIGLSLENLQALENILEVIDRLHILLRGLASISALSFKHFPERLSIPAGFEVTIFCIILKSSSSKVALR